MSDDLREALAEAMFDEHEMNDKQACGASWAEVSHARWMDRAGAAIAFLVEAGWGPTAAHEACIERLREDWQPKQFADSRCWWWKPESVPEPMTEAEQEVMSR